MTMGIFDEAKLVNDVDELNDIHEQAYQEICKQGMQARLNFLKQFMEIYDERAANFVPAYELQTEIIVSEIISFLRDNGQLDLLEYGGLGSFIAPQLTETLPEATITFVDNSDILLDICRMRFSEEGQRIAYIKEKPQHFTQPDTYHVAHFAYNLSGYRDEQKLTMLKNAYHSLSNGGVLIVQEFVWRDDARINALAKRINENAMASLGIQNELYKNLMHTPIEAELLGYIQQAGFSQIVIPFTSLNFTMMMAKKLEK